MSIEQADYKRKMYKNENAIFSVNITAADKEAFVFLKSVADKLRDKNIQIDDSQDSKQNKIPSSFFL